MASSYMWDISPSQAIARGIFRDCAGISRPWDMSPMTINPDIQAIRALIEREMKAKGFSKRSLSSTAGLSQTAVRDVLERTENPGIGTLYKIAEALEIPMGDIIGTGRVPLVGEIGAGGRVAYFDDGEERLVSRPPLAPGPMVAYTVKGDSMLPKYEEGDVVYVYRHHDAWLIYGPMRITRPQPT